MNISDNDIVSLLGYAAAVVFGIVFWSVLLCALFQKFLSILKSIKEKFISSKVPILEIIALFGYLILLLFLFLMFGMGLYGVIALLASFLTASVLDKQILHLEQVRRLIILRAVLIVSFLSVFLILYALGTYDIIPKDCFTRMGCR